MAQQEVLLEKGNITYFLDSLTPTEIAIFIYCHVLKADKAEFLNGRKITSREYDEKLRHINDLIRNYQEKRHDDLVAIIQVAFELQNSDGFLNMLQYEGQDSKQPLSGR